MEHRVRHLLRLASTVFGIAVASVSSADPILTLSTDEIELSPNERLQTRLKADWGEHSLDKGVRAFYAICPGLQDNYNFLLSRRYRLTGPCTVRCRRCGAEWPEVEECPEECKPGAGA